MATSSYSVSTRISAGVWLIGKPTKYLSHARLPSNGDVLQLFYYYNSEENQNVKKSIEFTIKSVLEIWEKARIPTQRLDAAKRKLNKLFDKYITLKKSNKKGSESSRLNEELFKSDLLDLFDIASKDALEIMRCDEDKTFLIMQREDTLRCSMAGVDMSLSRKESRKRKRDSEAEISY